MCAQEDYLFIYVYVGPFLLDKLIVSSKSCILFELKLQYIPICSCVTELGCAKVQYKS